MARTDEEECGTSPFEIAALVALTAYAIYRQTQRHEVVGRGRFKLALIYGVVGLAVGGFRRSDSPAEIALIVASLGLSVVVGLARGHGSRLWAAADGRVSSQGTVLTIALFLGLVASKFALGTIAYLTHVSDEGGFGEIMLMIAVMVAFQAELIWRRAKPLGARAVSGASDAPAAPVPA